MEDNSSHTRNVRPKPSDNVCSSEIKSQPSCYPILKWKDTINSRVLNDENAIKFAFDQCKLSKNVQDYFDKLDLIFRNGFPGSVTIRCSTASEI